jgi:hypothetical protein
MPSVIAPSERYLVATESIVQAGEVVEVDDATYASLVAQGWKPADTAFEKAPPRARSKPATQAEED